MAYEDDLLNAAQKRRRTGRSFFPAANGLYSDGTHGQIIQMSGEGSAYSGAQTGGYGPGRGALPPDQNPAYQAAIARPRLQRGDLTTIRTPSGGFVTVPSGSAGAAAQAVPGSQITQIGNQVPIDRSGAYARGYGAPNPTIQGGYQIAGGVANPIENITPQARIAGGAGSALDYFRSNPALTAATNALSGFGNSIARFFTPPQSNQVREVNQPTNFGVGGNFSQLPANPFAGNANFELQPRRYSDLGYY